MTPSFRLVCIYILERRSFKSAQSLPALLDVWNEYMGLGSVDWFTAPATRSNTHTLQTLESGTVPLYSTQRSDSSAHIAGVPSADIHEATGAAAASAL